MSSRALGGRLHSKEVSCTGFGNAPGPIFAYIRGCARFSQGPAPLPAPQRRQRWYGQFLSWLQVPEVLPSPLITHHQCSGQEKARHGTSWQPLRACREVVPGPPAPSTSQLPEDKWLGHHTRNISAPRTRTAPCVRDVVLCSSGSRHGSAHAATSHFQKHPRKK